MNYFRLILIIISAAVFTLPVSAAIVPCTTNCTICDLLKLVQNIINFFLYQISIPLATAMILAGGILILTAGSSQKRLDWGKMVLTNAIVGFAIIMAGWLFINSIMNLLVNPQVVPMPWNEIQCQSGATTAAQQQQQQQQQQEYQDYYQRQQQQQRQQEEELIEIIEPRLRDAQWTQNETNSGEVATLRIQIETLQAVAPDSFQFSPKQAFMGDLFDMPNDILDKIKKIVDPDEIKKIFDPDEIKKIVDPLDGFDLMFPTPKPTPKPTATIKPKITPKIPTPAPTTTIGPTKTPVTTVTPTPTSIKKKQPDTFFLIFDIYDTKDNKKIDNLEAIFFLSDLMASADQMLQWNTLNLPPDTKVKAQVALKDEYGTNYGTYWSNDLNINTSTSAQDQKCIKIAGNNDSRKIVLMPLDGPIRDVEGTTCNQKWTDENFGGDIWGPNGFWRQTAVKYQNALQVPPFTANNFSIYYYNAGKPIGAVGQIECGAYAPVYIVPCHLFVSTAYLHHRYVVMELNPPDIKYDFPHELGHIIGLLADEYAGYGPGEITPELLRREGLPMKNCAQPYPGWWKNNFNIPVISGCYYGPDWFRDHENDIMRTHAPYFGPIDLYYLNQAIFGR